MATQKNQDKLKAALASKGPGALRQAVSTRQAINPVDIITAAAAPVTPTTERETEYEDASVEAIEIEVIEKRSEKPNEKKDKKESSEKTDQNRASKNRTGKPRLKSERDVHALLAVDKRQTERYSFEIYSDQKDDIAVLCDRYEKSTGKKLSASRLIREVLDYFLPGALKAFEQSEEES